MSVEQTPEPGLATEAGPGRIHPEQRGRHRGGHGERPSTGTYIVSNNLNIGSCAALATRGSVNTDVPFSPATVEIIPGAGSNTFGVQVRQLLFFGGALANQAIHAAVIC